MANLRYSQVTWDVVRAVDVFGQRTDDERLFEYAAQEQRALVTTDAALEAIAIRSSSTVAGRSPATRLQSF